MTAKLLLLVACAAPGCTWDWDALEPPKPLGPPGAWVATFAEECAGSSIDRGRWNTAYVHQTAIFRRYDWDNAGVADANVGIGEGLCTIRVDDNPSQGAMYTSGVLDSARKFEQAYGFFEVRVRAAAGVGISSAVNLSWVELWPPQISLMNVDGAQPTENHPTVWYDLPTGGPTKTPQVRSTGNVDLTADFHVYGLDWSPAGLVFYQDGVEIGRIADAGPAVSQRLRFELVAHVGGVGGNDGPTAATAFPATMTIDYVRAWRRR